MTSYPERPNLNFHILHKNFDAITRDITILNRASNFENAKILHDLACLN